MVYARSKYCLFFISMFALPGYASDQVTVGDVVYSLKSGHSSLSEWLLSKPPEHPIDNPPTLAKVELGKKLFFDVALSVDGEISCASCHNPALGWSDGLPTARGFKGMVLPRATPTIINAAYNIVQNWDGRNNSLEAQATEPITHPDEMHLNMGVLLARLTNSKSYLQIFKKAFPREGITKTTIAKAIASFERTVLSTNSSFDRWVKGDNDAMSANQIKGFRVFMDPEKGDCMACHSGPNFTDSSFHNIGLQSHLDENPDLGRFAHLPLPVMRGAFKTPTLRNISKTAPYFHDGSSKTLREVVEHYQKGGIHNPYLSKNMKMLKLSKAEVLALIDFMEALTGDVDVSVVDERFTLSDAR